MDFFSGLVEIWGYNRDWNGNPFGDPLWLNTAFFDPLFSPWPSLAPGEDLATRFTFTPTTSGAFLDSMVVNDAMGLTDTVVVKANLVLPPTMVVDVDTIQTISLDNQEVITEKVTISNVDGGSDLHYTVESEFVRTGFATSTFNKFNSEINTASLNASVFGSQNTGIQTTQEFDDEINYFKGYEKAGGIGYGANSFSTLTKFKAPSTGFNLSHVSTWYVPAGMANATLEIAIGIGDIDNPTILHEQSFETETAVDDLEGALFTFELEKSLQFHPGETIYMIITYPFGPARPQGFVESMETMSDISYIEVNGGWLDVTTDSRFPLLLWMNALHQSERITPWVTLSSFEGTVVKGESMDVDVVFTPSTALSTSEKAVFKFISNDMNAEAEEVTAMMTLNNAPEFVTIPMSIEIDEAMDSTFIITAIDNDDHDFTFEVDEHILIDSSYVSNDTLSIQIVTDYESAGDHTFNVTVTDEHGVASISQINVMVNNVNRTPIAVEQDTLYLMPGVVPTFLDPTDIFLDEDGDELTFGIATSDDGVVMASLSQGQFAILGLTEGETEVALIATDIYGASVMTMLHVIVEVEIPTSIDKDFVSQTNLRNYPNPVLGTTTFAFNMIHSGDVSIQIFNMNGVLEQTVSLGHLGSGNNEVAIDLSSLVTGVHIYTLSVNGSVEMYNKLIKK